MDNKLVLALAILGFTGAPLAAGQTCLEFGGASLVSLPVNQANVASLPGGMLSATLWVRIQPGTATKGVMLSRSQGTGISKLYWQIVSFADGTFGVEWEDVGDAVPQGFKNTQPIDDGLWHHIGVSISTTPSLGGGVLLMLDGQLTSQVGSAIQPQDVLAPTIGPFGQQDLTPLTLGAAWEVPNPPQSFFVGQLDDVTLWNRALSPVELAALRTRVLDYNAPGLVGYWRFEEAGGQDVTDASGGDLSGSLGVDGSAAGDDPSRVAPGAPTPAGATKLLSFYPAKINALGAWSPGGATTIQLTGGIPNAPTLLVAAPTAGYQALGLVLGPLGVIDPSLIPVSRVLIPTFTSTSVPLLTNVVVDGSGQGSASLPGPTLANQQVFVQFLQFNVSGPLPTFDVSEGLLLQVP